MVDGENVIELSAKPFDIMMELESVFITGQFSISTIDQKWVIDKPEPLLIGSWKSQGYPFYGYGVSYQNHFVVEDMSKSYSVRLPDWSGPLASLHINARFAGLFGAGQGDRLDISNFLNEGVNVIQIRVCGSFKNLLGPFHDSSLPRKVVWPSFLKSSPIQGPPAAADYDLIDYGLFTDFIVERM